MVNVTKSNFIKESNDLIRNLPSAAFVAIDEEMTGIVIPNSPRPPKDQTPDERYNMLKAVPEKYSIIQLGICLFHEHPDFHTNRISGVDAPEFVARKYNFWMFPPADLKITREVVLNPSSISFLNRQTSMSFDVWTREGVPFVTGDQAEELISKYQQKQLDIQENKAKNRSQSFRPGKRKVELRRTEDIDFHARAMASLREWLDSAQPNRGRLHGPNAEVPEGLSFLLPPANSFLRRALYESIGQEYPSLILENAGTNYPNQIRVLRLDPAEQKAREERLLREGWEELIVNQIGVWRVFMALSLACHGYEIPKDSVSFAPSVGHIDWVRGFECMGNLELTGRKVPIVVHNGYMDLMFLMSHFHSHKLPPSFPQAKALVHSYFPMIYDTKLLVTECVTWNDSATHLENLYVKVIRENEELGGLVELAAERDDHGLLFANTDTAHCADHDAFMTGCVYVGFCHLIAANERFQRTIEQSPSPHRRVGSLTHLLHDSQDKQVKSLFGRNKLYLMQSIYTIDLESESDDPLCRGMISESIFRISNFDPSVTTRTIIQCLSDVVDSRYQTVNFELYWCNDTTFLVAASRKPFPRTMAEIDILREHGALILEALKRRFKSENIVSWLDYTTKRTTLINPHQQEQSPYWSSRLGRFVRGIFGWGGGDDFQSKETKKRDNDADDVEEDRPQAKRRRIR